MHTAAQFGQQEFVRLMLVKVPATITTEPPRADTNNPLLSVNAEVSRHSYCSAVCFQAYRQIQEACDGLHANGHFRNQAMCKFLELRHYIKLRNVH